MGLKNLALWVDGPYQKDALFDAMSPLNRDNCLSSLRCLKARLAGAGWDCHTSDIYRSRGAAPDAVLFLDIPSDPVDRILRGWAGKARKYVVLQECEVVKPGNWKLEHHAQFDAVFTWAERLVDDRRYFKVNFANHFPEACSFKPGGKDKLCVLVSANKKKPHPLELYSEREKTIRWFEANHPEDFDLYGIGWDRYAFNGPAFIRVLNRVKPLTGLLGSRFPSYRGPAALKKTVMEKYGFSICYENARGIPGYITEKIFDSFFAGCVPVYWGAPDAAKYIPGSCFIDRGKFRTHEELYAFIKNMSETDYSGILDSIRAFIASPAAAPFSDKYYGDTIARVVAGA
jgi:hypothetical protein